MKNFSKLIFIFVVVIAFTSIVLPRNSFSMSIAPPCFKYSYSEKYTINKETLPVGIDIVEVFNKTPFLVNNSSGALLIERGNFTIRLINGLEYEKHNNIEGRAKYWTKQNQERSNAKLPALINVGDSLRSNIPNTGIYSSNDQLKNPKPIVFEINAIYDDKPLIITGTLSYDLVEKNCPIEKETEILSYNNIGEDYLTKQESKTRLLYKIKKIFSLLKFW